VHALTDVTGFGLAGHALEMARGSELTVELEAAALPVYPHAEAMIAKDLLCGGSRGNRSAIAAHADFDAADETAIWLACDAQTSGGLLIAVAEAEAQALLDSLLAAGVVDAAFVGALTGSTPGRVVLR